MSQGEGGVTPPLQPRQAWTAGQESDGFVALSGSSDPHLSPVVASSTQGQGFTPQNSLQRPDQLTYATESRRLEGGRSPVGGGILHSPSSSPLPRQRSSSSSTPNAPTPTPRLIKVKQLEGEVSQLRRQVDSLQQRNSELEKELQSFNSITSTMSTDSVDVTSLQMKVAQLEDQNMKLKEASSRNLDRMTEEISRLQLSGMTADSTVNQLRQQVSMNEWQMREKEDEIGKLRQEKSQLEQSLTSMKVENERIDGERRIIERERDRLREEGQNNPGSEQAASGLDRSSSVRGEAGVKRRLMDILRDKKKLEDRILALDLEVNQLKADKQVAEQEGAVKIQLLREENERFKLENERMKHEQLARAEQEKQLLQQQLDGQGAELRETRQNLEWREREMNTLREEHTRSEQLLQQQLQQCKTILAQLEAELAETKGQLEEMSVEKQASEAKLEKLGSEYQSLKSTSENEKTKIQKELQQMIEDRDRAKEAQQQATGRITALQDAKKKGDNLQDALKKEAEYIMTDLEEANARLSMTEQDRDKAIHQKDKAMNELAKRNKEIEQKEDMIKQLKAQLKAKEEQLSILDIQLQTYHSDFETERKSREQMAGRMEQMRDEQEKKDFEIKQLKSQLNKSAANLMKAEMAEMEDLQYYTSEMSPMDDPSMHYATVQQSQQLPYMTSGSGGQEPLRARDPDRTHPPGANQQGAMGQYQMHAPRH